MALKILLVDDSATVRSVIAKTLRLAGVSIGSLLEAGDGQQALEIMNAEWVDLVLTDINMPRMNGIELVETMARDGLLKTVPVVVISTEGSAARIDQLKATGISAYLRKPFTPEQLRAVITQVVEQCA